MLHARRDLRGLHGDERSVELARSQCTFERCDGDDAVRGGRGGHRGREFWTIMHKSGTRAETTLGRGPGFDPDPRNKYVQICLLVLMYSITAKFHSISTRFLGVFSSDDLPRPLTRRMPAGLL